MRIEKPRELSSGQKRNLEKMRDMKRKREAMTKRSKRNENDVT